MRGGEGLSVAPGLGSKIAGALSLGLLLACSSSAPVTQGPAPIVTPSGFKATYLAANRVLLTWASPTKQFDSYRLEVRTSTGDFQEIGLVGVGEVRLIVESSTDIPELLVLFFRLTALYQGVPIGPGATVQFTEPLRYFSASVVFANGQVLVAWSSSSKLADRVEVRRSHYREPAGVAVADPVREFPVSANGFVDTDIGEATTYLYEFTLWAGDVPGDPYRWSVVTEVAPPTDLVARAHAGSVELQWKNHTTAATEIQIIRCCDEVTPGSSSVIARLPPDAGAYRDGRPDAGLFSYMVMPQVPVYGTAFAQAWADVLLPTARLDTEIQPGPHPPYAVFHPSGEWLLCGEEEIVPLPPDGPDGGSAIPPSRLGGVDSWVSPCLQLDGAQRPHVVFATRADLGVTLHHAWFDGNRWNSEEIVTRGGFSGARFGVDRHGGVHLVWVQAAMYPDVGFEYAHAADGGWVAASLPGISLAPDDVLLNLAVDESDVLHVLLGPRLDHLRRSAAGAWSLERIPVNLDAGEEIRQAAFLSAGPDGSSVFFTRGRVAASGETLEVVTSAGAAWSAPVLIASNDGYPHWLITANSPDGRRLLVTWANSTGTFFENGDAGWRPTSLGGYAAFIAGLGLDAEAHLHVLERMGPPVGDGYYERFDEAP